MKEGVVEDLIGRWTTIGVVLEKEKDEIEGFWSRVVKRFKGLLKIDRKTTFEDVAERAIRIPLAKGETPRDQAAQDDTQTPNVVCPWIKGRVGHDLGRQIVK